MERLLISVNAYARHIFRRRLSFNFCQRFLSIGKTLHLNGVLLFQTGESAVVLSTSLCADAKKVTAIPFHCCVPVLESYIIYTTELVNFSI